MKALRVIVASLVVNLIYTGEFDGGEVRNVRPRAGTIQSDGAVDGKYGCKHQVRMGRPCTFRARSLRPERRL